MIDWPDYYDSPPLIVIDRLLSPKDSKRDRRPRYPIDYSGDNKMCVENYSAKTYQDIDNEKCSANRNLMEQERLLNDRATPMIYGTQSGFEGVISSQRWHVIIFLYLMIIISCNKKS